MATLLHIFLGRRLDSFCFAISSVANAGSVSALRMPTFPVSHMHASVEERNVHAVDFKITWLMMSLATAESYGALSVYNLCMLGIIIIYNY